METRRSILPRVRLIASSMVAVIPFCTVIAAAPIPQPVIAWESRVEIDSGGGLRGPWRQNDSNYDYVDDPAVAIDGAGRVAVVWVDQARKDVLFQLFAPDRAARLEEPANVSRSPAIFSWLPRVVLSPGEPARVDVLWQEIVFSGGSHGGETFYARSVDGGRSFSAPLNLSNSAGGDGKGRINRQRWDNGSHDLARDADGRLYAAWTEYHGPLWFSRSTDGGATFSRPQYVAGDDDGPARVPTLAVDSSGKVYLGWTVGEDERADIHVCRSEDKGRSFGEVKRVARSAGYSDAPKLAVDSRGTLHLVYAESPGGPFGPAHVRYTQSSDGGITFGETRVISDPLPNDVEGAGFPAVALDRTGALYVLWELYPTGSESPRGLGYTMSNDGGRTFERPAVVPGSADPRGVNGSLQGHLMNKLAVNATGAVVVANSRFRAGEGSAVWLVRGQATRARTAP